MDFKISNNELLVYTDKELYSHEALLKCFYWYGADYDVTIDGGPAHQYCIILQPKADKQQPPDFQQLISKIKKEVNDYQLRHIINRETQHIRNLLVAKAFAYYDDGNENPDSIILDPVGFDPENID